MGASGSVIETGETNAAQVALARHQLREKNKAPPKDELGGVHYPTFLVSLVSWADAPLTLPEEFKLRISYESLDFVRKDNESPIVQFPFQNIICWGSSNQNFQFKIFNMEKHHTSNASRKEGGILISLRTFEGRKIEDTTMSTVQKLMVDINQRAITKPEFKSLLATLLENDGTVLREDWKRVIDQFTSNAGRLFLAKQGMELLIRIGEVAPFEKFELACLLYDRIINRNSFQLLVNTFADEAERENLIHRLKLHQQEQQQQHLPSKSGGKGRVSGSGSSSVGVVGSDGVISIGTVGQASAAAVPHVVTDCMILPEKPRRHHASSHAPLVS